MVVRHAAHFGDIAMLEWACVRSGTRSGTHGGTRATWAWDEFLTCSAAAGGQVATLAWLRAQELPCPWGEAVAATAAYNGRQAALQWLRAQRPPCPWDRASVLHQGRFPRGSQGVAWIQSQPD
ncbi:MAG: hypothetical protein J3K34DRAFT_441884 [Monoraphidium minutum]|nr:MAG: hypothetical protein J3K34DRAFT_441884 [Monoraphidium minutum]